MNKSKFVHLVESAGNLIFLRSAQYDLEFERACIQFNIGAVESQIACLQNRASDEGIKLASKYYQVCWRIF